jgi:ribokinase
MPSIRRPIGTVRAARHSAGGARPGRPTPPRIVVLGDLVLDVVVAPARPIEIGTDVPGGVAFVQGGSAATTARWLGRLGARTTLITAVGRDAVGRALVEAVRSDGVTVHASRVARVPTARIAVLVGANGERSFVTDRAAADRLEPDALREAWFDGADALHLPAYSLLGTPLGLAGRRAVELARAHGAAISLDLASIGPLLANGRRAARELIAAIRPDVLFATRAEAKALLGGRRVDELLEFASVAVVKRGAKGATVLARSGDERLRFEVPTTRLATADTTGAGDAFDAGYLVAWLTARATGGSLPAALRRAAVAGHRAAARQLGATRRELPLD